MSFPSLHLLWAALALVIPLAIFAGHRRPNGPIVVAGGGALAAFAAFWLRVRGVWSFLGYGPASSFVITYLVFLGGMLLFVAAWALALAAAAQGRRWRWLALLALAGYLSAVGVLVILAPPNPCFFGPPPGATSESFAFACSAASPLEQLLVIASYFAGPAVTLVFGLRASIPRLRAIPDGLTASPLPADTNVEAEPDSELEVSRERL